MIYSSWHDLHYQKVLSR